MKQTNSI